MKSVVSNVVDRSQALSGAGQSVVSLLRRGRSSRLELLLLLLLLVLVTMVMAAG